jgi:hypothetical protein
VLFTEDRHEQLKALTWDESRAREAIERIVRDTEVQFSPTGMWPMHPLDDSDPAPQYLLYHGASGVIWALRYLQALGAAKLSRDYAPFLRPLLALNRKAMGREDHPAFAAYLMGDTPIQMLRHGFAPSEAVAAELARLVEANIDDPARELMWGAPGTLLAALFMHERTGEERWRQLYQVTARKLWSQLEWSEEFGCHYWTQALYGQRSTYIDAVHGFVATAVPLIHGRHLLDAAEWQAWQDCIANTVRRTADREGPPGQLAPSPHAAALTRPAEDTCRCATARPAS